MVAIVSPLPYQQVVIPSDIPAYRPSDRSWDQFSQ